MISFFVGGKALVEIERKFYCNVPTSTEFCIYSSETQHHISWDLSRSVFFFSRACSLSIMEGFLREALPRKWHTINIHAPSINRLKEQKKVHKTSPTSIKIIFESFMALEMRLRKSLSPDSDTFSAYFFLIAEWSSNEFVVEFLRFSMSFYENLDETLTRLNCVIKKIIFEVDIKRKSWKK